MAGLSSRRRAKVSALGAFQGDIPAKSQGYRTPVSRAIMPPLEKPVR